MKKLPYDLASEAAERLETFTKAPNIAVVLGSGLGAFADQLVEPEVLSYGEIPGFPNVGVVGHAGKLVVGKLGENGPRVAALAGRVHLYEGHGLDSVVHPARTLSQWGVQSVVFTNAAGAITSGYKPGDLMLITDHINQTGQNPLTGPNDERLGTRFPDMSEAYDHEYAETLRQAARSLSIDLKEGVYVGLSGPSYETPAEIRMMRAVGADAVGMSTVCEVIAARHVGLRIAGISCLTNYAAGLSDALLNHAEVKETADLARDSFIKLLSTGIAQMDALSK